MKYFRLSFVGEECADFGFYICGPAGICQKFPDVQL